MYWPVTRAQLQFCTLGTYFPPYGSSLPFYSLVWVWACGWESLNCLLCCRIEAYLRDPYCSPAVTLPSLSAAPCFWSLWYQNHSPKTPWNEKTGFESEKRSESSPLCPDGHGQQHQTAGLPLNRTEAQMIDSASFSHSRPTYPAVFPSTRHLVVGSQLCHIHLQVHILSLFFLLFPTHSFIQNVYGASSSCQLLYWILRI